MQKYHLFKKISYFEYWLYHYNLHFWIECGLLELP